ncbi:hypothetical protein [Roseivirga sp. E12]|uniref:hypothetical protein n=1 Tax=Roseivirga sp. E12 TaxID=2819237 RepID=UPI001ABBFB97|nr:hypothetical protein [Roseivirga sp. E12]MBO3699817.1 hypothetical protein [Roseivirga sp. E12]
MISRTIILIGIAVLVSTINVLSDPRKYFNGLFKEAQDETKSEGMYLVIIILTLIGLPLYFILNASIEVIDLAAVVVMSMVFLWKTYEVFRSPKTYFIGLFKGVDDPMKSSQEPLGLMIFSAIVVLSYFLKM